MTDLFFLSTELYRIARRVGPLGTGKIHQSRPRKDDLVVILCNHTLHDGIRMRNHQVRIDVIQDMPTVRLQRGRSNDGSVLRVS